MTMHINLSSEMESFIKGKVASSFYGNATEVIRDAIRRMQSEEDRVLAWRSAVQKGNAELDRGEGMVYNAQALGDITQAAIHAMHSGQPMDREVLP
ncbi:MAG: type II toxin-antitoxin system ParD family antitoxin [Leptothrix sp. (in: Bacteria)]|jgi:antitoxin ParD1/3/4|nr:type II toxin-antitoxin system ParD family antitoxin [Leptothrix sp. (in: b-proteobacteria)]